MKDLRRAGFVLSVAGFVLSVLSLVILAFGYAKKEETKPTSTIISEELAGETIDENATPVAETDLKDDKGVSVEKVEFGEDFDIDLNGDGEIETINVSVESVYDEPMTKVVINGEAKDNVCIYEPVETYYIVDWLDDGRKELLISTYGPSDDYETYFYHYNNGKLKEFFVSAGVPFETGELSYFEINDKGFSCNERINILETNYVRRTYTVLQNTAVEEKKDFYPLEIKRNGDVTLLTSIKGHIAPDNTTDEIILEEGLTGTIEAINDDG